MQRQVLHESTVKVLALLDRLTEDVDRNPAVTTSQMGKTWREINGKKNGNIPRSMRQLIQSGMVREAYGTRPNHPLYQLTANGYRYLANNK